MKLAVRTISIFLFSIVVAACCEGGDASRIANEFSSAYLSGSLPLFEAKPFVGKGVIVVVEHSIDGIPEEKLVFTPKELDDWLNSRLTTEGMPQRGKWNLEKCSAGICVFSGNQRHNHQFLSRIEYSSSNGEIKLERIVFEEGD